MSELKPLAASFRQLIESSNECNNSTSPQDAVRAAGILFGCYRRSDAADPDTYAAAVAAVLADYSPAIVKRVTDPRTGLPGRSKFLPTVSEIKEACDDLQRLEWNAVKRQRDLENQLSERRRAAEVAARPRETIEELRARHGENWGIKSEETKKKSNWPDLNQIAAKYGVDPKVAQALPDLPIERAR